MLQAYINGIPYITLREFSVTEKAGNKTSSEISVEVAEAQAAPVSGDIVELRDGDEIMFWGTCGIPRSPKYQTGRERKIYRITCGNANAILGRRIINVAYQNNTLSQIVNKLFDNYVSVEGISLGMISDISVVLERYTGSNYNLQTALNELADLVGATWHISNDRKFYFLKVEDFPRFPRVINAEFMLGTDLQHNTKDYKVRTVQYIAGATDTTSPQTEYFDYDGQQKTFITSFPLIREPAVYINDVQVDPAYIGVNGIDDSNPNILFAFSYNSQIVTYKGAAMMSGDIVTITYTGQFPIRIAAYNDAKIAEVAALTQTSGMIEDVHLATGVKTSADANQLALSLIEQFNEVTGELRFWFLSEQLYAFGLDMDDTKVLTLISFDFPALGISGDYVVTERTIEPITDGFKILLTLTNRDYLKTYGQTIAALKRDVVNLTIRGEDTVVQSASVSERVAITEETEFGAGIPAYCTPVLSFGSLFVPQGLDCTWYPTAYAELSGGAPGAPMYPCESLENGSMFAPTDLGMEVYPT